MALMLCLMGNGKYFELSELDILKMLIAASNHRLRQSTIIPAQSLTVHPALSTISFLTSGRSSKNTVSFFCTLFKRQEREIIPLYTGTCALQSVSVSLFDAPSASTSLGSQAEMWSRCRSSMVVLGLRLRSPSHPPTLL